MKEVKKKDICVKMKREKEQMSWQEKERVSEKIRQKEIKE